MRRKTSPSPKDIAPKTIARLFPRRLPARVFWRPQRPRRSGAREGHFCRRVAARAKAAKSSCRHGLARQAAFQHTQQHLAAGHRLRQNGGGDRGLSAARTRASFRRRQVGGARDLLPGRLLDVMECGEAGAVLCLFQRGLVPEGTDGWERAGLPRAKSASRGPEDAVAA